MRRVVVIGAGPAGSAAAMRLCRERAEVVLLERRPIPRTKVCGSGLSPWTLKFLDRMGVGEPVRREAYPINGARIAGVTGDGIELSGDHETAVLLRERFDQILAEEAARRGADLRDQTRVLEVVRDGGRLVGVKTSDGDLEADAVIDASGAKGQLATQDAPERRLHTMLGWYEGIAGTTNLVELWFDPAVKPHYGWLFPETATRANVGIVFDPTIGEGNARERFHDFVERRLGPRLRNAALVGKLVGHPAHASTWPRDLVQDGLLIAGEAGQLVDSATAEGIYHALVSGDAAAETLGACFADGARPTASRLASYNRKVRLRLGARLAGGRALMEALRTPVLDVALRFSRAKATRTVLTKAFTGLYHG